MKGPFKKNKVVKKKKSKGKKDDWSFEGGGVDSDAKPATEEKQRFRQTQDRDERLRRSRVKLHDRKIKNTFVKKMASKVRLEDVLLAPETFTEEVSPVKEEKAVRPEHRSSLSVLERIRLFVGQSLDDNRRQSLANTVSKTRSTANDEMELDTAIDKLDKEKIKASGSTILQEVSSITPSNATFDWLFVANSKSISSSKWSKIADSISERNESEYSVTGKILECAPIEKFTEVKSFGAIPGLHKVWAGKQDILYKYPMNKVMSYVSKYLDVFLEGRDHRNDLAVMKPIVSHLCAHIVKARAKVVKHNQKLKHKAKQEIVRKALQDGNDEKGSTKKQKSKRIKPATDPVEDDGQADEDDIDVDLLDGDGTDDNAAMQDQGFCRPRILILAPLRGSAKDVIDWMIELFGENTTIINEERYDEEYGLPEEDDDDLLKTKPPEKKNKPLDWQALFENRNIDDDFKMGIQINPGQGKGTGAAKGVSMRLFSDFYISDVIIASPIALKLAIENGSDGSENSKVDSDFLSSLEIVYMHQADVLYMQNWEHVQFVMNHTNRLPKKFGDTDYSRVRPYFLDGEGAARRQIIMTTAFFEPEMQSTFRLNAKSSCGFAKIKRNWSMGSISNVAVDVRQVFQIVPGITGIDTLEVNKFNYFKSHILAPLLRLEQPHTLIVAPNYFQYVKIRNELIHQEASAAFICEYSRESEISRGRSRFFQGRSKILLYSGRAHFFRRFKIKGVHNLIFYGLPEYPHFYPEFVNMLSATGGANAAHSRQEKLDDAGDEEVTNSCLILFTPYDKLAIERVVGQKRCDHIFQSKKSTFMFC